ncbi:hypothetical protein GTA08_BOTSDO09872 [Neofusicoccum parvum]|uniref:Extracellular membrane protein CFEM domain-containing protein n=3 Tax=Neofusicoccum TaxID=407951 RepID=A0ABR3SH61_9PEZI|nr:putative gpi anchored protein [Neofusicoccum parvum UCRNP2]GME27413.1 hypothetical protein GTA08_BOTSDO09872 [Neofusicoccum parvum]GME62264.1 hypothetical protein GTA08_BOTSDO09872 [Neofusicoccum parvum]
MQNKIIALFFALAAVGTAIDANDIPAACRTNCQTVVELTQRCDAQNDDNDAGEYNCVCTAANAVAQLQSCSDCVGQNGGTDFDDADEAAENDVLEILNACKSGVVTDF